MRLDRYLFSQKISPSRSRIVQLIKSGNVMVDGKRTKASYRLKGGEKIDVSPSPVVPSLIQPEEISLLVLHEDDDLIVINKEPQMVVHPGAGNPGGTLTNALLWHCRDLSGIGGVIRPGIVHRLDKGTSGVMVAAKNDKTHIALSDQFKNRKVKKIYWAVVYGRMKKAEGTFSTFIARHPSHRKKFSVSQSRGKKAVTHYRVLKEGEGVSLLELKLETGRTHQIRVHLTDAGHSIVGDPLYGGHSRRVKQVRDEKISRLLQSLAHPLLHARTLAFVHPTSNKLVEFTAESPGDFKKAMELCF